jgi:secondary thiamine-phosphate synthase enzyme
MKTYSKRINVESTKQIEFIDLTDKVQEIVENSGIREGIVVIFAPHTTMGVVINHNEPMLLQDFMRMLYKVAPVDDQYTHDLFELRRSQSADGRSNGHSHCKSVIIGVSETIPFERGKLMISETQSIFAVEFDGARKRDLIIQVVGI